MILFRNDDETMDDVDIDHTLSVDQVLKEREEAAAADNDEPELEPIDINIEDNKEQEVKANQDEPEVVEEETTEETVAEEVTKSKHIPVPIVPPAVEAVTAQLSERELAIKKEVDSLLEELDEIERSLGMQTEFDDIEFPEFKPIILPPVQYPEPPATKVDFAKLDDEQLDLIMRQFKKIDAMEAQVKAMKEVIDERLNVDFRAMYENIMEKTNIEAIKTYRNVQAVIIEENAKQNQALFGIDNKSNSLKKRMNNVLIFAIVSFVVSILVMLVTILPALGVKLF